ncbi:MAG: ferritin [Clostridiales bacterium]
MLSEKLGKLLNDQIRKELFSAYFYLSMSAYFYDKSLDGMANFFRVQAQEERDHGMMIFDYIKETGGRVLLQKIDEPKHDFKSIVEVFKMALDHERGVTKSIYNMVNVANEEKDHKTITFLRWFIDEQVEEESTAESNLAKVKMMGDDGRGIFMIDQELLKRVYTPPIVSE